jgi:hypothetical protein
MSTPKIFILMVLVFPGWVLGQYPVMDEVPAKVDFSKKLREWDGFGVNYVEVPQTMDYLKDPQEYGGFSLLDEKERQEILDMIFGDDGLRPGIVKMFYDPWHQEKPGGEFNHTRTTRWLRYFAQKGLQYTRGRGDDLTFFTTLYGPPPWATRQKFLRGRDLDLDKKYDLANYMIDWVKFCREVEGIPIKYLSLHNEGEDWMRWPADGKDGNIGKGHDYNMYWPPELVVDFLKFMRPMLDKAGLQEVGLTPGENSNWFRFSYWGYADAIADDLGALQALGLVTSHGFYSGTYGRWFGEHRSTGIDLLHQKRPDLHCWVTSTSWSKMDADNIKEHHGNIYTAKVNGITPWAAIQRPAKWVGGDPNPGCAFRIYEDGSYEVMRGYYYYKQVCRAGQSGMAVAHAQAMDSELPIIAFSRNGTRYPDAFVVTNIGKNQKKVKIKVIGGGSKTWEAFRTTDGDGKTHEKYQFIGTLSLNEQDMLYYSAPARSTTTFFSK